MSKFQKIKYVLIDPKTSLDVSMLVGLATQRGWMISSGACNTESLRFLESIEPNKYSPQYRCYKDAAMDSTTWNVYVNQCLRYANNYNDPDREKNIYSIWGEPVYINYNSYDLIIGLSKEEMYEHYTKQLYDSNESLMDLCELKKICSFICKYYSELSIDCIKDIRAVCLLSTCIGIFPNNGHKIINILYYQVFNDFKVIKSYYRMKHLLPKKVCKLSDTDPFNLFNNIQIEELSKVFFRYKSFLLGLKKASKKWANFINIISRKARHIKKSDNQIVKVENNQQINIIKNINSVRAKKLLNLCHQSRLFINRSGGIWINKSEGTCPMPYHGSEPCINLLSEQTEKITIKYPEDIRLTWPETPESFIGNYPIGTGFNIDNKEFSIEVTHPDFNPNEYLFIPTCTKKIHHGLCSINMQTLDPYTKFDISIKIGQYLINFKDIYSNRKTLILGLITKHNWFYLNPISTTKDIIINYKTHAAYTINRISAQEVLEKSLNSIQYDKQIHQNLPDIDLTDPKVYPYALKFDYLERF